MGTAVLEFQTKKMKFLREICNGYRDLKELYCCGPKSHSPPFTTLLFKDKRENDKSLSQLSSFYLFKNAKTISLY